MHHSYSSKKGDTLCPLGFHPQVRWPTRCKRCFRDYKEHGDRRGSLTDITSSSPSLTSWTSRGSDNGDSRNSWSSATNLAAKSEPKANSRPEVAPVSTSLMDLSSFGRNSEASKNVRAKIAGDHPQKLQIRSVIDNSASATSGNDVEFIIQVRKSRTDKLSGSSAQNDDEAYNDVQKGTEKEQIEKLRAKLSEMKARCEKAEKEKSEFLLRRLATMDTLSSKGSSNEMSKLQKLTKELQIKNEALAEDKSRLLLKIKNLEEEMSSKLHKNDRDKVSGELRSKLKAAETLCESLMDENEDMKKEIRELEEEIYELQDNFREEQVDEYSNLRKGLEQSNKNCRILSFKLRKVERKAETLESEKNELKKKYDEMVKVEEMLKRIQKDYESKTPKKTTDLVTKVQLKKVADEMQKEIGNIINIFASINEGKEIIANHDNKTTEENSSYNRLLKEHEALKEKFETLAKELASEKEKRSVKTSKEDDDKRNKDWQSLKKKLDEAVSLREAERREWDKEKATHHEEKEKLKSKLLSLSAEKLKVYNDVLQLNKDLEAAKASEGECVKMEKTINELKKELSTERQKHKKLQDDLISFAERENSFKQTIASAEQAKAKLDAEVQHLTQESENSKAASSSRLTELNAELVKLKKEKEKLKTQLDKDKQARETEVAALKKKVASLEKTDLNSKRIDEVKQSCNEKVLNLENELKREKEKHEKVHTELDDLKQSKVRLENEKETLTSQLSSEKRNLENARKEMKNLQDRFVAKEDEWRLEKFHLEEQIRERDATAKKSPSDELNDKVALFAKENTLLREQLEEARRINEDLSAKLKDYDGVSKAQHALSADTTALEAEIRSLRTGLADQEKARKSELAQCKLRYEHRVKAVSDELQAIQNQLSRHKRERDTYKHMLEGAQRTIAELKSVRQRRQSGGSSGKSDKEEEEDSATYVAVLERQISCMEDELSETRLEASSAKAELVSEKSAWHIKLSEMQSRINELEEERMLTSRRSKIPGLKVKMELAWQKEREEQQRLLQETATLARDLRQTLFEIERERVNERVENKRRQDQLKKVLDEEKEENKKKLVELQCDLLELRDAHAKLRTSNEKMRREKERHEKEREEFKEMVLNRYRLEKGEMRNIDVLLQQVENLQKLFPELNGKPESTPEAYTPTPPRRLKGPKSRESSPMKEVKDATKGSASLLEERTEKLKYTIEKLREVAKDLEESKRNFDESRATKMKKFGKRSTSVDSDPGKVIMSGHSKPRLKRKSVSLEQTTGRSDESQFIWSTHSNVSSVQSLESEGGSHTFNMQRDSSVDSRLSGGSTKSEMLPRDKKYNKGLLRKFTTKLTKSSSVDDPQGSSPGFSFQSSGSETSINDSSKIEKKNLKKKLTDMFKRGSKTSRSIPDASTHSSTHS